MKVRGSLNRLKNVQVKENKGQGQKMSWRVDVKDIKRSGNVEVKDRNGSVK